MVESQVKDDLRIVLTDESKKLALEMVALEIMQDHLHLFVGANPTHIPYAIRFSPQQS